MNYVFIAIVFNALTGGFDVSVMDYNLTKSDCAHALQYVDNNSDVTYKCEIQGKNWEGENWKLRK